MTPWVVALGLALLVALVAVGVLVYKQHRRHIAYHVGSSRSDTPPLPQELDFFQQQPHHSGLENPVYNAAQETIELQPFAGFPRDAIPPMLLEPIPEEPAPVPSPLPPRQQTPAQRARAAARRLASSAAQKLSR